MTEYAELVLSTGKQSTQSQAEHIHSLQLYSVREKERGPPNQPLAPKMGGWPGLFSYGFKFFSI